MKTLKEFLEDWVDVSKRNRADLEEQFATAFPQRTLGDCPKCESRAITELRKHLFKQLSESGSGSVESLVADESKKYVLLPGNHQFVAGDKIHNNDNITDEIAEFYVKNYPHTKILFAKLP